MESFAENLPGLPDNIRRSKSGGYWVAFASMRSYDKFSLIDFLMKRPWLRNFVGKVREWLAVVVL